jgi:cell wall-associated NlpC family hydrolase
VTLLITFGNRLQHIGIVALTSLLLLTSFLQPVHADEVATTQEATIKPLSFVDRTSRMAIEALSLIGIHYKRGGNTPEHGLDCSGLVRYVFRESGGKELPRTSAEISKLGESVDKQDLQPGDLVFFNTLRRTFSHVGIYLGENKFIHAPSSGGAVRIDSMDLSYWKARFNGARRIESTDNTAANR